MPEWIFEGKKPFKPQRKKRGYRVKMWTQRNWVTINLCISSKFPFTYGKSFWHRLYDFFPSLFWFGFGFGHHSAVFEVLHGMPGIEPKQVICKTKALPTVLRFQSLKVDTQKVQTELEREF